MNNKIAPKLNIKGKGIEEKKAPATALHSGMKNPTTTIKKDPKQDDFIEMNFTTSVISQYANGFISSKNASVMILGEIRHEFYKRVNFYDDKLDIETMKYIDSNLFDPLIDIISSILNYGSDDFTANLIKHHMSNFIESVLNDDQENKKLSDEDLNYILNMIDEVHN